MENLQIKVVCPECESENTLTADASVKMVGIMSRCVEDDGGCNKLFACTVTRVVSSKPHCVLATWEAVTYRLVK